MELRGIYREEERKILPMLDSLPRWLYCCLTEALRAAVASMAEFDLPGVEWRGEPLLMEATTRRLAGGQHPAEQHCP